MTIKEISYKDERLEFFADQRRAVQKRYDRLQKDINPDEPYLSERRQSLDDCGRELSFYNDVIKILEAGAVSKFVIHRIFEDIFLNTHCDADGELIVRHNDLVKIKNRYQRELDL